MLKDDEPVLRVHRRQFIITPEPHPAFADWQRRALPGGSTLFAERLLPVSDAVDASGNPWILLGRAVETKPSPETPEAAIAAARTQDVPDAAASFAGRWVLIGAGRLYPDASGALAVHYAAEGPGGLCVTSSPGLLRLVAFDGEPGICDDRAPLPQIGLSWFPPPASRFDGARRLLPSQSLDLSDGTVAPIRLLTDGVPGTLDEVAPLVAGNFERTMVRLGRQTPVPLQLGLTAGNDSRPMLALAQRAGAPVEAFTRLNPRTSLSDRAFPPELARIAGLPHRYLNARPAQGDRLDMLDAHTAGFVAPTNLRPLLNGERDDLVGITISGGGFALSRGGLSSTSGLPAELPDRARFVSEICASFGEPLPSDAERGLGSWHDWVTAHPEPGLDWRMRFFLEHRRGGWQAAKNQAFDLMRVERFQMLNSRDNHSLVLALGEDGYRLQRRLVEIGNPDLLALPFNPPDRALAARAPVAYLRRRAHMAALEWTSRGRLRLRQARKRRALDR